MKHAAPRWGMIDLAAIQQLRGHLNDEAIARCVFDALLKQGGQPGMLSRTMYESGIAAMLAAQGSLQAADVDDMEDIVATDLVAGVIGRANGWNGC